MAVADPNEPLPNNTLVVATITTVSEEPMYAKLYLYPMVVADFVNKEISIVSDSNPNAKIKRCKINEL